ADVVIRAVDNPILPVVEVKFSVSAANVPDGSWMPPLPSAVMFKVPPFVEMSALSVILPLLAVAVDRFTAPVEVIVPS
ncbi:hypothetical protein, partial [Klebsiella pneumoniae]|uniref:hypothetical protein n=1 Tax=Klebsiella pneumoniae TaxID=573 RepID=UPI0030130AC8